MRLVITDLTDMGAGSHCVAGWDLDTHRMVRPLPVGHNWSTAQIQQFGILPGAIFEFQRSGKPHPGSYPHSTEDTEIVTSSTKRIENRPFDWFGADKPAAFESVNAMFDGQLKSAGQYHGMLKGCYVVTGEHLRSLGAIELPPASVSLFEDNFKGNRRLKAIIHDDTAIYSVSVSCHSLKKVYAESGIEAANASLPATKLLHIRLGLARPFPNAPNRCNLMLNGIHG